MMDDAEIAIIDPSTLSLIGLKSCLDPLMEGAKLRCFNSFEELVRDTPDAFFHYFVAVSVFFEHTQFFLDRQKRTIVLVASDSAQVFGMRTLNVSQKQPELIRSLLALYNVRHRGGHPGVRPAPKERQDKLTPRETQVAALIVKGLLNKEIADRLNISLTTVITHRKNLLRKLGIRSTSALTVWAVMQGIVEADSL